MYDFFLFLMLSRISFHVVVLVYCQTYMFLFAAFILSVRGVFNKYYLSISKLLPLELLYERICPPVYLLVTYGE